MFNPGDVVRLKSGGPDMTVKHIGTMADPKALYCEWFDGKKLTGNGFAETSLKAVDPNAPKIMVG